MMNCIVIDDDLLSRNLAETYIKKVDFLNILQSFSDPISALSFLSKNNVDLIFLDIEMPEMNGMKFIETIQQKMPQIILTTSHTEFAIQAFEYDVTDYLVKPLDYSRFYKAIMKAKNIFDNQALDQKKNTEKNYNALPADHDIYVKVNSMLVKLNTKDILYIEALGNYIIIHADSAKYTAHTTMKEIEAKLPVGFFMRVHLSFIVRLDKISKIDENIIVIKDKLIPVSRSNKPELMHRLKRV